MLILDFVYIGAVTVLQAELPCITFSLLREAHPALYSMRIGVLSPGAKRPGREADTLLLSSVEVKNEGSYTSASSIRLRGVDGDIFTFTSILNFQFVLWTERSALNTLRTGSFKLFKRPLPEFLTILTL